MAKAQASQIITEVRAALNDPNSVRWSNTVLFNYLYAAELLTAGTHPETQFADKVENPSPVLLTQLADYTTISFDNYLALVHFVCYRAFLEDSDDAGNQKLAMNHLQLYKDSLGDVSVGR